jgi:ACS family hexuronate transporter-like MFS transporter
MALFDGGSAAGAIVAPPLVSWIALQWGWQEAFVVTGALAFLWSGAWLFIYQPAAKHRWLSVSDREKARLELGAGNPATAAGRVRTRELLADSGLWTLMAVRFASSPVWWFYVFWLPDFLSQERGLTLAQIGFFGWIPYVAVDVGKIIGGIASDRLMQSGCSGLRARKLVMGIGALAMGGGAMVSQAVTLEATLAWICVATFGFGLWSPNVLALHCDIFPSEKMATAFGLTGTVASIGGSLSA